MDITNLGRGNLMAVVRKSSSRAGASLRLAQREPGWVRALLIGIVLVFVGLFLVVPVVNVFYQALARGWGAYVANFTAVVPREDVGMSDDARDKLMEVAQNAGFNRAAIWTTVLVAGIVVPLNTVFGLSAAWLITKFSLRFKSVLLTLIDVPFSVSPVIAGLLFVLIFGLQGFVRQGLNAIDPSVGEHIVGVTNGKYLTTDWAKMKGDVEGRKAEPEEVSRPKRGVNGSEMFWGWVGYLNTNVIFHLPGIVLATCFVTFPFVARELIPMMDAQGTEEEQAAITLGASGFQMFRRVTLMNIKWGLLYGVVLCNARAMGEFGAVNVVSGNIRGQNSTVPLRIQQLYEDYDTSGAFAMATLLAALALVTLVAKAYLEHATASERGRASEEA